MSVILTARDFRAHTGLQARGFNKGSMSHTSGILPNYRSELTIGINPLLPSTLTINPGGLFVDGSFVEVTENEIIQTENEGNYILVCKVDLSNNSATFELVESVTSTDNLTSSNTGVYEYALGTIVRSGGVITSYVNLADTLIINWKSWLSSNYLDKVFIENNYLTESEIVDNYYNKSTQDNRFVNANGDNISGTITSSGKFVSNSAPKSHTKVKTMGFGSTVNFGDVIDPDQHMYLSGIRMITLVLSNGGVVDIPLTTTRDTLYGSYAYPSIDPSVGHLFVETKRITVNNAVLTYVSGSAHEIYPSAPVEGFSRPSITSVKISYI